MYEYQVTSTSRFCGLDHGIYLMAEYDRSLCDRGTTDELHEENVSSMDRKIDVCRYPVNGLRCRHISEPGHVAPADCYIGLSTHGLDEVCQ